MFVKKLTSCSRVKTTCIESITFKQFLIGILKHFSNLVNTRNIRRVKRKLKQLTIKY